ncbi:MAG: hypothetical protein MHM6MM_003331 [Cercozoa sp. M6MM]
MSVELTHVRLPVLPYAGGTVWLHLALCYTLSMCFSLVVWIVVIASRATGLLALLSLVLLALAAIAVYSLGSETRARFARATEAMPLEIIARLDRFHQILPASEESDEKETEETRLELPVYERPDLLLWRAVLRDMTIWQQRFWDYVREHDVDQSRGAAATNSERNSDLSD